MNKKRNQKPSRKMKPVFMVFCEGDTEEAYVNFLRKKYRLPVKVISKKVGLSITPGIIQRHIQAEKIGPGDKITSFLMYDLDKEGMIEKLAKCKDSISITSNPSVELWFFLHADKQTAAISTGTCVDKLKKSTPEWTYYKEGALSEKQKQFLWENRRLASDRAKQLHEFENPSSSVYRLLEAMDKAI
jgi:hypothetical protein